MKAFIATMFSGCFLNELTRVSEYLKKEFGDKIKLVKPENLHITYAFLGDVSSDRREDIIKRMKAVKLEKFSVSAGNLGRFPDKGDSKVIWLGINEGIGRLEETAEKLRVNLAIDGFVFKNKFFPHITLGRVRREGMSGGNINDVFSQALKLIDGSLSFDALNIELFESVSGASGQVYKSLYKMKLL